MFLTSKQISCAANMENTRNWPTYTIPADNRVARYNNVIDYQSTSVGLTELFLINNHQDPLIAIGCVFDPSVVTGSSFTKLKLTGFMGFQTANAYFKADQSQIQRNRDFSVVPQNRVAAFESDSLGRITTAVVAQSDPSTIPQVEFVVRMRPESNVNQVLVFTPGMIDYNGKPSPLSYLKLKFNFPNVFI